MNFISLTIYLFSIVFVLLYNKRQLEKQRKSNLEREEALSQALQNVYSLMPQILNEIKEVHRTFEILKTSILKPERTDKYE